MLKSKQYFLQSTLDHLGNGFSWEIAREYDVLEKIVAIESIAKRMVALDDDDQFFGVIRGDRAVIVLNGEDALCSELTSFLRLSSDQVGKFLSAYKFHPLSSILIREFLNGAMFGFDEYAFGVETEGLMRGQSVELLAYCEKLNQVASKLRQEARDRGGALSRNFVRGAQQNYKSLMDLLRHLLSVRSRVLVVRVDLLYRDAFGVEDWESRKTYSQVSLDRSCFIDHVQKTYRAGLLGYAWKLEYGASRGYHYHMVFFFDGAKHHKDVALGMQIGNFWVNQTDQRGTFHNCNAYKKQYPVCGLGMFQHADPNAQERFDVVASYLTKADYHARLILPGRQRSFQRTFCKLRKGIKGRPRRRSQSV